MKYRTNNGDASLIRFVYHTEQTLRAVMASIALVRLAASACMDAGLAAAALGRLEEAAAKLRRVIATRKPSKAHRR